MIANFGGFTIVLVYVASALAHVFTYLKSENALASLLYTPKPQLADSSKSTRKNVLDTEG